jgi:hypothetical protein
MKYDCGLIDNSTNKLESIRRIGNIERWPPELLLEAQVLVNTPGFTLRFLAMNLGLADARIAQIRATVTDIDHIRTLAVDNWNSITYDDALKLAQIRRPNHMPIVCKPYILEEVLNGELTTGQISLKWKIHPNEITTMKREGPFSRVGWLPEWFKSKIPGI